MKNLVFYTSLTALVLLMAVGAWADPDLVIYYDFEAIHETISGDLISDMSGNGLDGTINGDVVLVDGGKHGQAAKFATGSFLDLHGEDLPAGTVPTEAGSICAWANVEETGDHHAIFNARASDETWLTHPELRSDHGFRWLFRAAGGTTIFDVKAGEWVAGEWIHFAGVYSQADGVGILYINGEEVGREAARVNEPIVGDWEMGARVGYNIDNARPFTGMMDDFCIFKRALSQNEIQDLMENFPTAVSPRGKLAATWAGIKKL